jgi:hypothetical protein
MNPGGKAAVGRAATSMMDEAQDGASQAPCLHARRSPSARAFAETVLGFQHPHAIP